MRYIYAIIFVTLPGDFGISKVMDQTIDVAKTCVGTPCYLAPEMCQDIPYTSKADVWVRYYIYMGKILYIYHMGKIYYIWVRFIIYIWARYIIYMGRIYYIYIWVRYIIYMGKILYIYG